MCVLPVLLSSVSRNYTIFPEDKKVALNCFLFCIFASVWVSFHCFKQLQLKSRLSYTLSLVLTISFRSVIGPRPLFAKRNNNSLSRSVSVRQKMLSFSLIISNKYVFCFVLRVKNKTFHHISYSWGSLGPVFCCSVRWLHCLIHKHIPWSHQSALITKRGSLAHQFAGRSCQSRRAPVGLVGRTSGWYPTT